MLIITILLVLAMLLVCWFDVTRYIIPDWLNGALLLLYPFALWLGHAPGNWKLTIIGAVLVFGVGYFIFIMKWMGGGDVKLLTVCALWVGLRNLPNFLFTMSIIGAVFAVLLLIIRKAERFLPKKENVAPLPRILRDKEPMPYGVAIALGFLLMLWTGRIPTISF